MGEAPDAVWERPGQALRKETPSSCPLAEAERGSKTEERVTE
jgi:hypothetical protein